MAGKAVSGRGGLVSKHRAFVKQAGAEIEAALNPWAFWMHIGSEHDSKGQPTYTETGHGSVVTVPVLLEQTGEVGDRMDALFVGPEAYSAYTAIYTDYKQRGWFDERRGNSGVFLKCDDPATTTPDPPAADYLYDDGDVPF